MQKCSHIPSRRELRVECTLGWEAYGQPQAEGAAGAARNACINWNQYYNVCRSGGSNPHNGAISFDNIGYAWIAIFQVGPGSPAEGSGRRVRRGAGGLPGRRVCSCLPPQVITLEGWVDIMYYVMDAHSFYNFIYFILLIIVSAARESRGLGGAFTATSACGRRRRPRRSPSVGVVLPLTPRRPSLRCRLSAGLSSREPGPPMGGRGPKPGP